MTENDEGKRIIRLLYIEDDLFSRDSFSKVYSKYYDIDTAANADEAIELIGKFNYDGFLVDINLGRSLDGLRLSKLIRQRSGNEKKPFIALTSYAGSKYRHEFMNHGMTHVITKPVMKEVLLRELEKIFGPPFKLNSEKPFEKTGA